VAKLAIALSPPVCLYRSIREAFLLLTDPAERALAQAQIAQAVRIAKLIKTTADDINEHPSDYVVFSKEIGFALGEFAGMWFTKETVDKSAQDFGENIGSIVGQVAFEIILQIIIELTTAGAGNVARAGAAVGKGTRFEPQVSAITKRL